MEVTERNFTVERYSIKEREKSKTTDLLTDRNGGKECFSDVVGFVGFPLYFVSKLELS